MVILLAYRRDGSGVVLSLSGSVEIRAPQKISWLSSAVIILLKFTVWLEDMIGTRERRKGL